MHSASCSTARPARPGAHARGLLGQLGLLARPARPGAHARGLLGQLGLLARPARPARVPRPARPAKVASPAGQMSPEFAPAPRTPPTRTDLPAPRKRPATGNWGISVITESVR